MLFDSLGGRSAEYSRDRLFRYVLRIPVSHNPGALLWVMLNPSDANEERDDPTSRAVISFTKTFGYGTAVLCNLYAYRTPKPAELLARFMRKQEIIGVENDSWIEAEARAAARTVVAWGSAVGTMFDDSRAKAVLTKLTFVDCLGCTASGQPRHPLWVKGVTYPVPYTRR
jgi:hypothetical protein